MSALKHLYHRWDKATLGTALAAVTAELRQIGEALKGNRMSEYYGVDTETLTAIKRTKSWQADAMTAALEMPEGMVDPTATAESVAREAQERITAEIQRKGAIRAAAGQLGLKDSNTGGLITRLCDSDVSVAEARKQLIDARAAKLGTNSDGAAHAATIN